MKDNVVGLPLARLAAGVDQRSCNTIEGTCLPICVGLVLIGIKNLDFITTLQVNAAVPSPLSFTFDFTWGSPFDMQLQVAKFLPGHNVAGAVNLQGVIDHLPFGLATGGAFPCRQVLTVKEH